MVKERNGEQRPSGAAITVWLPLALGHMPPEPKPVSLKSGFYFNHFARFSTNHLPRGVEYPR
jgi:hypothetical protein